MADGNRNFNQRRFEVVRHAFNDFKYRITGQRPLEGGSKPPTIGFNVRRDGIEIVGYTNVQGDDDDGKISAIIEPADAMLLPILLEKGARMQPGTHEGLALASKRYIEAEKKWSDPRLQMTIRVGRNDKGVVYISLQHWKKTRPVLMVEMLPSALLRLLDQTDQPFQADVASERYALSWARSLQEMIPGNFIANYVPPKPKGDGQSAGGGGSGGGNRGNRGGGGGGYNRDAGNGGGGGAPAAAASGGGGSGGYTPYDNDDLPY